MTLEQRIDAVKYFLETHVCDGLKLKIPNDKNVYDVAYGSPKAFATFIPPKDKLPGDLNYPAPSVVVMPLRDEENERDGKVLTRLLFTVYDPGTRLPGAMEHEKPEYIGMDHEGWRGLLNFMERARQALRKARVIGDMELDFPLKRGLFNEEDSTPDFRPYYMGWMDVPFHYGVEPLYSKEIAEFMNF